MAQQKRKPKKPNEPQEPKTPKRSGRALPEEIRFVVPGTPLGGGTRSAGASATVVSEFGEVTQAVRVGARRSGGGEVELTARPGQDVVEITLTNGPTLVLHPQDAFELMRAQQGGLPQQRRDGSEPPANQVNIPAQLAWRELDRTNDSAPTRGLLQSAAGVVVDAVRIVRRTLGGRDAELAAGAVAATVDAQVDPGVYRLKSDALPDLKGSGLKVAGMIEAPANAPTLVLIHGTFSSTEGTFAKLWQMHPGRVADLFSSYDKRVYALDHPTLTASPFANALALLAQVPDNAQLHLLTHSRGGLVAEVVARVLSGQGLDAASLALFDGADYAQQRKDLAALAKHAKRGIRVTRIVRVACPARGTLLASKRLDAYLSVFRWALQLAGLKVLPVLVDFLGDVAQRRHEADELPGLEAMVPDSPTTQWLTRPAEPLESDLRVIAGDVQGDSVLSWVKTLLTDAFYWTDHDLVVQTRSMYGGTPRGENGAHFVLDRGARVSHFRYFENERTAAAIVDGLIASVLPGEYRRIGPLSWAGEDASGTRAARSARSGKDPSLPAVFVLPGILGSHLKAGGKRIWLGWRFFNNLDRLAYPGKLKVEPDGPVGLSYDDLMDHLAKSHEVIEFSYDWRRPIEEEAKRLADAVDAALAARRASKQPVRIVAHSMGGVVARTMQLERPKTWDAMLAADDARVLMLGTPNGGSYAPMQVMSGDDTFGNLLSVFGSLFDDYEARVLIAGMPGLLQLQADLLDDQLKLGTAAGWEALQDADLKAVHQRINETSWWHDDELQLRPFKWGLPAQAMLNKAVALRRKLDAQVRDGLPRVDKVLLVVGQAKFTPASVQVGDDGVKYMNAADGGDGRVTLSRALLPRVKTWQAEAEHGKLPDAKDCFDAYVDLLTTGTTTRLPALTEGGGTRGASSLQSAALQVASLVPVRAARGRRGVEPPESEASVFRLGEAVSPGAGAVATDAAPSRLQVEIVNGDLRLRGGALMIGHYRSLELTGAEWVADRLLDKQMSRALDAGAYPSDVGAAQVFANTRRNPDEPFRLPRPSAVIVVGLGEEGDLGMAALSDSVRQGVLAYAQRVAEQQDSGSVFDLAATLIGSGGSSMTVSTSAQAVALGVQQANARLAAVGWPQVRKLQLVERYLDRAAEALQALLALSDSLAQDLAVERRIQSSAGALRRPPEAGYRGVDYDFIAVSQDNDKAPLRFALDTKRARSEVRGQQTQSKLVRELVERGAVDTNRDPQIGRSLFQLMVPVEIETFLADSSQLLLQLDRYSAQYPWELLDTAALDGRVVGDGRPWALRSRLLRKLRTEDYRDAPKYVGKRGGVLVIGEPKCDRERYGPLPGALQEAREVAGAFGARREASRRGRDPDVTLVLGADALEVTNAAFAASYRVIHVAGHGDFQEVERDGERKQLIGGVVLSNGRFFGPDEVNAMRRVPDLVFINCCHIGRLEAKAMEERTRFARQAPMFAASVAEALIKLGVRCVVAAGWAVDDLPAAAFARRFYAELQQGRPFVDAVAQAREHVWAAYPDSNTWAAYQCYGDPGWRLADEAAGSGLKATPQVASAEGLVLRLQAYVEDLQLGDDERKAKLLVEVRQLDNVYGKERDWKQRGDVCAAFGAAYGEAFKIGDALERAIEWYEQALRAQDGSGSIKSTQQLGNLLARAGEKATDINAGRGQIELAITLLGHAMSLAATVEGACMLGSAYKRLAKLEERGLAKSAGATSGKRAQRARKGAASARTASAAPASQAAVVVAALEQSSSYYERGAAIAEEADADNLFYPLLNQIAVDARLGRKISAKDLASARASLEAKVARDPDFWSVIALLELRIYEAAAARELAKRLPNLLQEIADLRAHSASSRQWDSVRWQADFVLGPHADRADLPAAERDAAQKVLAALVGAV